MILRTLLIGGMCLAVLASSVGVVYVKHVDRSLFIELQRLERERDAMEVEWGKLSLEQSTWATHDRIERVAKEQLHLIIPPMDSVILVMP